MFQKLLARRAAMFKSLKENEQGFTLVELLVVILIIGILAAIAIPVFLGQQNSAKDSAVQSDLANAKIALIGYYTANGSASTSNTPSQLTNYGYTASAGSTGASSFTYFTSGTSFCASEKSGSGTFFKVTDSTSPASASSGCTTSAG